MSKPILCLDFDGVLHGYASGWKGARNIPDPPVEGAIAFLLEAHKHFAVAIHSSRSRYWGGRRAMKRWLRYHIAEHLWKNPVSAARQFTAADMGEDIKATARMFVRLRLSFPLWKPPAHVTIDDRAVTFTGQWLSLDTLREFKPWNKRKA